MHPLTAIRGKLISETMYRDIEKSFNRIPKNTSLQRVETFYQIRNVLIVILNMIIFVEWGWTRKITHYESDGKTDHKNEHNIR